MLGHSGEGRWLVYFTTVIALMLNIVPLPAWLATFWPQFLVLVVVYWSMMLPQAGGILMAFLAGICLDVMNGTQLGQHALALSFVAYLAIRTHLITRAKPLFEQALLVLAALLIYETVLWAIDGWSGRGARDWTRWVHAIPGALLWPLVVGILGRLHSPR